LTEIKHAAQQPENGATPLTHVTPCEVSDVGSPRAANTPDAPRPAGVAKAAFALAAPAGGKANVSALPTEAAAFERLVAIPPACFAAIAKAAEELGVAAEEHDAALADFAQEVERRLPQILTVLFVISQLPRIGERAQRHFRRKCGESHHDAQELSQGVVFKVLRTLTGAWPRGNLGAWLATVRDNIYRDHLRARGRKLRAMQRLEEAFQTMRAG
jgi:hypothetical protein